MITTTTATRSALVVATLLCLLLLVDERGVEAGTLSKRASVVDTYNLNSDSGGTWGFSSGNLITAIQTQDSAFADADDPRASDTQYTFVLAPRSFGFTVPTDGSAKVAGIQVDVRKYSSGCGGGGESCIDQRAELFTGGSAGAPGTVSSNYAITTSQWPSSVAKVTYGGPTDLWGTTWTVAQVNDALFGFRIQGNKNGGGSGSGSSNFRIDLINVTIYWDTCGDGVKGTTEECDDGDTNTNNGCTYPGCAVTNGWTCPASGACNKCGDGILQGAETCDDNNTVSNDGCDSTCRLESSSPIQWNCTVVGKSCSKCGDGVVQPQSPETCDDGMYPTSSGDGCSSTCQTESGWNCTLVGQPCRKCGNSKKEPGEACDDGNLVANDGCTADCNAIESGWVCPTVGSPCRRCGDSILQTGETCDDGNTVSADGCSSDCALESGWSCPNVGIKCRRCGDGISQPGEVCDDANTNNNDGCTSSCAVETGWNCPSVGPCSPICGDGLLRGNETCDDRNTANRDGCNATCKVETGWNCPAGEPSVCTSICGDGIITNAEECDDGNTNDNKAGTTTPDGCSSQCKIQVGFSCRLEPSQCVGGCGNGVKISTEQCDDNNTVTGDGCNSDCTITPGWKCNENTNGVSVCQTVCGDGVITSNEQCDDGVIPPAPGDGCDGSCQTEFGWNCTLQPSRCRKCGNGIVEYLEQCDDGDLAGGDGCDSSCNREPGYTCLVPSGQTASVCTSCGNGIREGEEACDDGGTNNGDGCSDICTLEAGFTCNAPRNGPPSTCSPICGDGIVTKTEGCDDNNANPLDGCDGNCQPLPGWLCYGQPSTCIPVCGNYYKTSSEQCDDGGTSVGDGCDATCNIEDGWKCNVTNNLSVCYPFCSDGKIITAGGERCDDGNNGNGDGCSETCQIEPGWRCSSVPSTCTAICADGMVILDKEACDDGNTLAADGCSPSCTIEPGFTCTGSPSRCVSQCGDGITASNEACDDGRITDDTDGCSRNCTVIPGWACVPFANNRTSNCYEVCGNGIRTKTENCDDGGSASGDGCDQNCKFEPGFRCEDVPNAPSVCTRVEETPPEPVKESKDDGMVVVYAVVPAVAAVGAIVAVVVLVLVRRRSKKRLGEPHYAALAFGADGTAEGATPASDSVKAGVSALEELLLDSQTLVLTLCNTTQSTEMDRISKALTYVFYQKGYFVDLLKVRIAHEIQAAESVNTLFRATSFASKMFTTYSKIVGLPYLWNTLGLIMHELRDMGSGEVESKYKSKGQKSLMSHTSIEVDPNKMDDESDSVSNQLQLQLIVHKIWKAIIDSEPDIPLQFRELFSHIHEEMPKRFSDDQPFYFAIGSFFFLRFIVPSLTTPHVYGLLDEPPSESVQRYLILISKTLQNIANGTLPGKKEQYMESMNDFIASHIKAANQFFDKIAESPKAALPKDPYPVPSNTYANAVYTLYKHVETTLPKINAALDDQPDGQEVKNKLQAIMQPH